MKTSNQTYDSETHIANSSAMSHMAKSEENMTNLKNVETRVTIGEGRTLTGEKLVNLNGYHKVDEKIHRVALSNMATIPELHANILSLNQPAGDGAAAVVHCGMLPLPRRHLNDREGRKI